MKNKGKIRILTALFAAVLCMAAFPLTAFAMTDTEPPAVTASIDGDTLHVTAKDNDSGVEAVFVNGKRYNYLVDGGINVPLKDCAGNGENIAVYAIDFAGNQSKAVQLENPNRTAQPGTPANPNPVSLTPDGNLTLADDIDEQEGESYKQFITVVTKAGNYFYIVIDRAGDKENVYFLNMVDEADLLALIEDMDTVPAQAAPEPKPAEPQPDPEPAPAEPEPEPEKKGGGIGGILLIVLALAAGGGAFYYFKILKPKQAVQGDTDLSELDELDFDGEDGDFTEALEDMAEQRQSDEREDEDE
jgi:hypothetical protein